MNTIAFLSHSTILNSKKIGKTDYYLITNNNDPTRTSRAIFVDLSHQARTQANYLSSLPSVMNEWQCHTYFLFLHKVTASLLPNLPHGRSCILDASAPPSNIQGYILYPLVLQDGCIDMEGQRGYVPQLKGTYTEREVWDMINAPQF